MLKLETNTTNGGDWVCESCERAPAAFLCTADSASLCAACDAVIHSANPLARRHHRVPISCSLYGEEDEDEDEDEEASWLLLNPLKNGDDEARPTLFGGGEIDEYLDLDDYNQFHEGYTNQHHHCGDPQSSYGGEDSIVPIQHGKRKNHRFQLGYATNYPTSMSQTVSISSMEVGVVPESASEGSISQSSRPPKGTIDLFSSTPIEIPTTQLTPMDREARVLRYREKKKTRKFEKTIRYASRKAYAETRPRIKGRFAKRRGAEVEVDQVYSSQCLMQEIAYGVVPSF